MFPNDSFEYTAYLCLETLHCSLVSIIAVIE